MTETTDLTMEYLSKRAKFKKRAESNLNKKVLDGLKQLERCANRKIYAYEDEAVERMFNEIETAVLTARKAFASDAGESKRRWVEL
jgi:hypothetical protein